MKDRKEKILLIIIIVSLIICVLTIPVIIITGHVIYPVITFIAFALVAFNADGDLRIHRYLKGQ